MSRRVTAKDVARLSGVSAATVSYVLNNSPGQTIPEATRERVRAAAVELSYVPSAAAASLRRGHSRTVLVVTERALAGYVTEPFLRAISERLVESELVPIVYSMVSDEVLLALVREIRPFGVIAPMIVEPSLLDSLAEAGVPHVYASGRTDLQVRRPWEERIGAAQARHLIERGSSRIVYAKPVTGAPRLPMADARELGARSECERLGKSVAPAVHLPRDVEDAVAVLDEVLRAEPNATLGICAFDDEVAAVAVAAARRLGRSIPHDLKIIGVDDNPFGALLDPPLTTVSVDARTSGRALAERFLRLRAGDTGGGRPSSISAHIVQRSTT